jgi:hypothetical protein
MTKVDWACGQCGVVTDEPHYEYDGDGGRVMIRCDRCAPCAGLRFVDQCEGCLERVYHA